MLVGVADDIWDLDWMTKLAGQFLAAGIIAWQGVQICSLPIGGLIGRLAAGCRSCITVFSIVLVMNAVNFIDGLDGLVAGVAPHRQRRVLRLLATCSCATPAPSDYFNLASFIAAVLIGACIGFLPLNWIPAKLFMGDSGALLLGLLMATSAIAITGQIDPAVARPDEFGRSQLLAAFIPILLPFAVLVVPLLDFGLAVVRRMRAGKSPFSPDRKHLHHRMLDMGHIAPRRRADLLRVDGRRRASAVCCSCSSGTSAAAIVARAGCTAPASRSRRSAGARPRAWSSTQSARRGDATLAADAPSARPADRARPRHHASTAMSLRATVLIASCATAAILARPRRRRRGHRLPRRRRRPGWSSALVGRALAARLPRHHRRSAS